MRKNFHVLISSATLTGKSYENTKVLSSSSSAIDTSQCYWNAKWTLHQENFRRIRIKKKSTTCTKVCMLVPLRNLNRIPKYTPREHAKHDTLLWLLVGPCLSNPYLSRGPRWYRMMFSICPCKRRGNLHGLPFAVALDWVPMLWKSVAKTQLLGAPCLHFRIKSLAKYNPSRSNPTTKLVSSQHPIHIIILIMLMVIIRSYIVHENFVPLHNQLFVVNIDCLKKPLETPGVIKIC